METSSVLPSLVFQFTVHVGESQAKVHIFRGVARGFSFPPTLDLSVVSRVPHPKRRPPFHVLCMLARHMNGRMEIRAHLPFHASVAPFAIHRRSAPSPRSCKMRRGRGDLPQEVDLIERETKGRFETRHPPSERMRIETKGGKVKPRKEKETCRIDATMARAWAGGAQRMVLPRATVKRWKNGREGTRCLGTSGNDSVETKQKVTNGSPKGSKRKKNHEANNTSQSLEELRHARIAKAEDMRRNGIQPYAYRWERTHEAGQLQRMYRDLQDGEEANAPEHASEEDMVSVAGRVVAKRVFGKLAFFKINDESGDIQLYLDKKRMDQPAEENEPSAFQHVKQNVDVGDIVGAIGGIKRTEKGELSVTVSRIQVLTKSLLPLPDKWHGLQDVEKRYRQRYVDLIVNPHVKDTFKKRAAVMSHFRSFLEEREFLEFETPVLESTAGGADAKPFLTYHNVLGKNLSLRIATELHLKRLVVGGFEKVYEIGRIFRNEGVSTRHNPEFTSIEVYQAYADYQDMMRLTEEIISTCAKKVCGSTAVQYQGETIDLTPPFRRATMHQLVQNETGVILEESDNLEQAKLKALGALEGKQVTQGALAAIRNAPTKGHLVNEIFEGVVEQTLMQPTFVMDHPVEISPLAKPHRSKDGLVERFELFVYGRELANAFSELTDPLEQRKRLQAQIETHRSVKEQGLQQAQQKGEDAYNHAKNEDYDVVLDEDFITALEHGMPPTAGMGLGIDRLVMILTDSPSIRDVIAFPLLK